MELRRRIPLGTIKYTHCEEEVAILKLISCEGCDALRYWEQLWEKMDDYEDMPFSCKELMPSAVKKIQASCQDAQWRRIIPGNAQFLAGLPRYTWTKNRYIINEYLKIASALEEGGKEFMALKGVCEMLDGNTLSLMRTSRDIDLLIHEEDWVDCRGIFQNLGWDESVNPNARHTLNDRIRPRVGTFRKSEGIFELDVHFVAIHGTQAESRNFTSGLWSRKVRAKEHPGLFIPSLYDRYVIAVANAFDLHNWREGHTAKYIQDILSISSRMDDMQLSVMTEDAERSVRLGDSIRQAASIAKVFRGIEVEKEGDVRHLLNFPVSREFLTYVDRFEILFQLLGMPTHVSQMPQVLSYLTSRAALKVYDWLKGGPFRNAKGAFPKSGAGSHSRPRFSIHLLPH